MLTLWKSIPKTTRQMYTQRLAMGPMATTPTSAATEMLSLMYFCTTWKTISRNPYTGVSSDCGRKRN